MWLKKIAIPKVTNRKFFIRWSGPWTIVNVISDITYRIQLINKGRCGRVWKVVPFSLLKCYLDESGENSQNVDIKSDAVSENLDQNSKGTSEINQNRGLQNDSEHASQEQNRVSAGEISASEEEDLVLSEIQSPVQPARAQWPRMERNPNEPRETRAHRPRATRRENRDNPNHRTEIIRSGRRDNEQVSERDGIINPVEENTANQSRVPATRK